MQSIWKSVSGHIVEYAVVGPYKLLLGVSSGHLFKRTTNGFMDERVLKKCQMSTTLITQAKSTRRLVDWSLSIWAIKNNNNNDTVVLGVVT